MSAVLILQIIFALLGGGALARSIFDEDGRIRERTRLSGSGALLGPWERSAASIRSGIRHFGIGVLGRYRAIAQRGEVSSRAEPISDLPLFIELLALQLEGGVEVKVALDRTLDLLDRRIGDSALVRELKVARWMSVSGYTWEDGFARAEKKLGGGAFSGLVGLLGVAMKQGGTVHDELRRLAEAARIDHEQALRRDLFIRPVLGMVLSVIILVAGMMVAYSPGFSGFL